MSGRIRLVAVGLLMALLTNVAGAQLRLQRPLQLRAQKPIRLQANGRADSSQAAEPSGTPAAQSQPSEPPSVEELLRRLDELEARARGNAAAAQPADRSGELVMMLEDSNLASTNVYGPDGIRYFVTRLVLINLSDAAVSIDTNEITLTADGKQFTLKEHPQQIESMPIQVQGQLRQYVDIKPQEKLEIPAQETAATWLLYAGLDGGLQVPQMTLKLKSGEQTHDLDVNLYQRGVLGLRVERVGPEKCLALLTIPGELNAINAGTLADELDGLSIAGAARAVIAFGETARRPEDQVLGWLLQGPANRANMQYSQLPALPAAIREMHVARLPGQDQAPWYGGNTGVELHATMESAAVEALRSAFEVLPREELRAELAFGDRLSRAAALAHGAGRLSPADLPLVLKGVDDEDDLIRRCSLQALSQFGDPGAIAKLLAVAQDEPAELRAVAVASLAGSRFPAAHDALSDYLSTAPPDMRLSIIGILAQYPRPIWSDLIYADAQADDPELRLAALRALVQVGHPRLFDLLADALKSEDGALREEAFARLVDRTDSKSEQLATEYALQQLAESPPSNPVVSILSRTRDPRAIPLLLKHLDAATENRQPLINLLATVGGQEVVTELVARYPQYEDQDRAATLEALRQLGAEEARPLALEALTSKQPAVTAVAANLLASDPEEESTSLLAAALEQTEDAYAASSICNALAAIGNAEARAALIKARESQDSNKKSYALSALQRIKFSSMAWQYTNQAQEPMRVASEHLAERQKALDADNAQLAEEQQSLATAEFEKADEWLQLALSFDPEFAEAYSRRGHIRLIQDKLDEAKADFERAVELDEYDAIGVTGLAIIDAMRGEYARAVAGIEAAEERFVDDVMFEYNAACVYGRALEAASKEDQSGERDAAMQQYRETAMAHLKRSVELGFSDLEHIRNDPDLNSLHDEEAFQELMQNAPESEEEQKARANGAAAPIKAVPAQVQEIQIQVQF